MSLDKDMAHSTLSNRRASSDSEWNRFCCCHLKPQASDSQGNKEVITRGPQQRATIFDNMTYVFRHAASALSQTWYTCQCKYKQHVRNGPQQIATGIMCFAVILSRELQTYRYMAPHGSCPQAVLRYHRKQVITKPFSSIRFT